MLEGKIGTNTWSEVAIISSIEAASHLRRDSELGIHDVIHFCVNQLRMDSIVHNRAVRIKLCLVRRPFILLLNEVWRALFPSYGWQTGKGYGSFLETDLAPSSPNSPSSDDITPTSLDVSVWYLLLVPICRLMSPHRTHSQFASSHGFAVSSLSFHSLTAYLFP